MRKSKTHIIYYHLLIFAIIAVLIITRFPCPFKAILNIPCPACGTLHALKSLINLKFYESLKCNPFSIPLVGAVWMGIHKDSLFRKSIWVDVVLIIISIVVLFYYIIKLFNSTITTI